MGYWRWDNSGWRHGRRIYSDYGGFDTGFMPFDLFTNELRFKDTSFHWITEKEHINPLLLMNILAERPNKSIWDCFKNFINLLKF